MHGYRLNIRTRSESSCDQNPRPKRRRWSPPWNLWKGETPRMLDTDAAGERKLLRDRRRIGSFMGIQQTPAIL
jgi:hypothetical protein